MRGQKKDRKKMSQSVNDGDGVADRPVTTSLEARSVSNVIPAGCGETLAMFYPSCMPLFVHKFTNPSDDLIVVHL